MEQYDGEVLIKVGMALGDLSTDVKEIKKQLGSLGEESESAGIKSRKLGTDMRKTASNAGALTSAFRKLSGVLGAVFAVSRLVNFGKQAIELASDLDEVQNVVDTSFGSMSYKMEQFADKAIETYGISRLTAKRTGSSMMAMASGMGVAQESASNMAIALTGLSADMASFYNAKQEDVARALNGVFTGETEALKRYGIVLTEANLKTYAQAQGITKSFQAMNAAEKAMLRYNYVMNATSLAHGDFAKTSDGWANQMRILSERWKEFTSIVGIALKNIFLPLVQKINALMRDVLEMAKAVAQVFGWEIKSAANSSAQGIADTAEALDDVATSAKKATQSLGAYDKLSVISSGDDGGGTGGGNGGGSFSLADTFYNQTTAKEAGSAWALEWAEGVKETVGNIKGFAEYLMDNGLGAAIDRVINFIVNDEGTGVWDFLTSGEVWSNTKEAWREIFINVGVMKDDKTGVLDFLMSGEVWSNTKEAWRDIFFNVGVMKDDKTGVLDFLMSGEVWSNTKEAWRDIYINAGFTKEDKTGIFDFLTSGEVWSNTKEAWKNILIGFKAENKDKTGIFDFFTSGEVLSNTKDAWLNVWYSAKEKTAGAFGYVKDGWKLIGNKSVELVATAKEKTAGALAGLKAKWDGIKSGSRTLTAEAKEKVAGALSGIKSKWDGIKSGSRTLTAEAKEKVKGALDTIKTGWEVIRQKTVGLVVNAKEAAGSKLSALKSGWETLKTKAINLAVSVPTFSSIRESIKTLLNGIIEFFNKYLIDNLNDLMSFTIPKNAATNFMGINGSYTLFTIKHIPKLAQGAVIPPNREFLATLGDQKRGVNIETPLDTMIQAFNTALAQNGGTKSPIVINLGDSSRAIAKLVWDETEKRYKQTGVYA